MAGIAAQQPEPPAELPEVMEELLIEEVSIDGMCGVY
ncbi:MAG TPA: mycofactocin precursor MftA [Candidatus Competibacteraceae bacterium]|nr:mycofactocin precursor MftA [Candidatus Competibacteraceae bacterium]HRY19126.1 mycofactocin precursor MftA [Candidatus Competibacteraceae bacterium]